MEKFRRSPRGMYKKTYQGMGYLPYQLVGQLDFWTIPSVKSPQKSGVEPRKKSALLSIEAWLFTTNIKIAIQMGSAIPPKKLNNHGPCFHCWVGPPLSTSAVDTRHIITWTWSAHVFIQRCICRRFPPSDLFCDVWGGTQIHHKLLKVSYIYIYVCCTFLGYRGVKSYIKYMYWIISRYEYVLKVLRYSVWKKLFITT